MPLMTAFAFGRLARVNVFHHSPGNSVTLEHPCDSCVTFSPSRNRVLGKRGNFIPCCAVQASLEAFLDQPSLVMVIGTSIRTAGLTLAFGFGGQGPLTTPRLILLGGRGGKTAEGTLGHHRLPSLPQRNSRAAGLGTLRTPLATSCRLRAF